MKEGSCGRAFIAIGDEAGKAVDYREEAAQTGTAGESPASGGRQMSWWADRIGSEEGTCGRARAVQARVSVLEWAGP